MTQERFSASYHYLIEEKIKYISKIKKVRLWVGRQKRWRLWRSAGILSGLISSTLMLAHQHSFQFTFFNFQTKYNAKRIFFGKQSQVMSVGITKKLTLHRMKQLKCHRAPILISNSTKCNEQTNKQKLTIVQNLLIKLFHMVR